MQGQLHGFGRVHRAPLVPVLLCLSVALAASSCLSTGGKHRSSGPDSPEQQLAARDATITLLKDRLNQQDTDLAARDALIKQLEEWLLSQQRMLDNAMQEVVRVQAKQRSLESRAEAAAEIAEAEIGLKALSAKAGDTNCPEVANAEQLLTRASDEFDRQNFGGALYLVGQAKSLIKLGDLRLGQPQRPAEGGDAEMPFVVPLTLTLNARGNLREGPGQDYKVLVTLDSGSRITAFFTKGAWMRVESDGGMSGWISRSLVSPN